jgi:PAS domain S-box-containing protein
MSNYFFERLLLDENLVMFECRAFQKRLTALWEAWREFQANGELNQPEVVRPGVLASWERSRANGIDPYLPLDTTYASQEEIEQRLQQSRFLIEVAVPILQTLEQNLEGSGFRIDLLDPDLLILAQFGDREVVSEATKRHSVPGAFRNEESCGTNAINLAALLRKPVQIVGPEHYNANLHYWTCSSAPIFSPEQELLGVINIAGHFSLLHKHTLGMTIAVAKSIEQGIQQLRLHEALKLSHKYLNSIFHSVSNGIIAVDSKGTITTFNQAASEFLEIDSDNVIGRSADEVFGANNPFTEVLTTKEPIFNREILLSSGGQRRSFVGTIETLDSDEGAQGGVVGVVRPLSSIKGYVRSFAGFKAQITFSDIVGDSPDFRKSLQLAKQAATLPTTILLQGESGTGKEVFAQAIHNASAFRDGPFVAVNCAGIPGELVESELFGYESGAFTGAKKGGHVGKFELAEGGTLFLDEIGSMPLNMQAKLLRALQTRSVMRVGGTTEIPLNTRFVYSANTDLWQQVQEGSLREDLFYRINVVTIVIPPLRNRLDDIPLLTEHFCKKLSSKLGVSFKVADSVYPILTGYHWPGNVRELENAIERSAVLALARGRQQITPDDVLLYSGIRKSHEQANEGKENDSIMSHSAVFDHGLDMEQTELAAIRKALAVSDGNVSKASRLLGIHRSTLYRKLDRYGISR